MYDSDYDFREPDTKENDKKIHLQKIIDPDIQDEWIEMRDEDTNEIVYYKKKPKHVFYPFRNSEKGEIRHISGKLIEKCKDYDETDSEIELPKIKSKLGKIRCDIIAKYETSKVIDKKETLVYIETNEKNIQNVLKMKIEKEPLRFYYKDMVLYDKDKKPLFIEWKNVKENVKDGKHLLKGEFFLRNESNSQPTRLLRKMLKMAGYPEEYWDTHSSKGSALRPYNDLTTKIDGKIYTLGELFPKDTRKLYIPKKPKRKKDEDECVFLLNC